PLLCRWPDGYELVVPAELWGSLGESARLGIMRHELAHYQRGDVWKSLAVRLLALPHWFNPAAWLAARRFEEAAEWACDEAAVAGHTPQTEYARTLLALAEASLGGGSCHPSMSRWNLSARVRRLLADSNAKDSIMKKLVLTVLAAVLVAFCLVRIDLVAKPNTDVAQPPSAVEETPNDAQQPGAVVLHDANDVQQSPSAVAEVGNDDQKPGDTARQPDAKETINPTRRALRYEGKTFDEWKQRVAKGVDQEQALSLVQTFTAFGSRGYGREATEQILLLIRQHGPDPNKPEPSPPMGMGGPMGPMMGPGGVGPMGPAGPMGPMGESPESQLSSELVQLARTAFIDGFGPGYGVLPRDESLPVLFRELRAGNAKSIVFVLGLLDQIGERSPEATAALAQLARSQPNADARYMTFFVLIKLDPSGDATADFLDELVNNNKELPSLPASPFIRKVVLSTTIAEVVVELEIAPGYRGVLRVVERCLDHAKPGVRDWAIRHVADFLRDFHAESTNAPVSAEHATLVQRLMNRLILAYAETDLKVRPEILARLDSRPSAFGGLRGSTPAFDQIYSLIESAARSTDANLRRAAEELLRDLGPRPEPGLGMGMGGPGMMGGGMAGPMGGPTGGMGPVRGGGMPGMGPATVEAPRVAESASETAAKAFVAALADGKTDDALAMLSKDFKESKRRELPKLAGGMDFSQAKLVKSAQAGKVFRAGIGTVAVKANGERFWLCLTLHEANEAPRGGEPAWKIAEADFVEDEDDMTRYFAKSVATPLRLSIRTAASQRVGGKSESAIQLRNWTSTTFTNVEVDVRYDECMRPILASPGYTERDGSLVWKIDSLGPMETVIYRFVSENIRATKQAQCSVKVRSDEGAEASDSCSFPIEGPVREPGELTPIERKASASDTTGGPGYSSTDVPTPTSEAESPYESPDKADYIVPHHNQGGSTVAPSPGMAPGIGGGMPGMGPATEPPPSVEEKLKKPAVSRDRLRLQGKSFDQWKDSLRTELSHDHRTEAIKALAIFAANGYAKEATETILELAREQGNSFSDDKGQPNMMSEAVAAFGRKSTAASPDPIPAKAAVPILVKELKEGNEKSRFFVLTVLTQLGSEGQDAVPALVDFIEIQEHKDLRPMALAALMKTDPPADTFIKVLSKVIDAAPDRRTAQVYLAVIQADEIRFARDSSGRTRRPLAFSPQDTRFLTLLSSHAADPKSPIRRDAITMLACSMYFTLESLSLSGRDSDGDLPRIVGMIKKGVTVTEKDARLVDSLFGEVEQSAHEWLRRLAISYAELDDRKLPASNYMQQLANNVFFVLWTRSVSEGDDQELRQAVSDLLELKEMTAIEALQNRLLSSTTASSLSTLTVPTVPTPTAEAESPYKSPGKAYYIVTHHNQGG
ncbi:MAG TPA: hypothetical protein DD670_15735, partial [Planctomycetaceae bacterium]|nr:hypothetical protein [Planctomycetaceae bacterium]